MRLGNEMGNGFEGAMGLLLQLKIYFPGRFRIYKAMH